VPFSVVGSVIVAIVRARRRHLGAPASSANPTGAPLPFPESGGART
jgi:hypothetical protein